jgi:hypothetical protein
VQDPPPLVRSLLASSGFSSFLLSSPLLSSLLFSSPLLSSPLLSSPLLSSPLLSSPLPPSLQLSSSLLSSSLSALHFYLTSLSLPSPFSFPPHSVVKPLADILLDPTSPSSFDSLSIASDSLSSISSSLFASPSPISFPTPTTTTTPLPSPALIPVKKAKSVPHESTSSSSSSSSSSLISRSYSASYSNSPSSASVSSYQDYDTILLYTQVLLNSIFASIERLPKLLKVLCFHLSSSLSSPSPSPRSAFPASSAFSLNSASSVSGSSGSSDSGSGYSASVFSLTSASPVSVSSATSSSKFSAASHLVLSGFLFLRLYSPALLDPQNFLEISDRHSKKAEEKQFEEKWNGMKGILLSILKMIQKLANTLSTSRLLEASSPITTAFEPLLDRLVMMNNSRFTKFFNRILKEGEEVLLKEERPKEETRQGEGGGEGEGNLLDCDNLFYTLRAIRGLESALLPVDRRTTIESKLQQEQLQRVIATRPFLESQYDSHLHSSSSSSAPLTFYSSFSAAATSSSSSSCSPSSPSTFSSSFGDRSSRSESIGSLHNSNERRDKEKKDEEKKQKQMDKKKKKEKKKEEKKQKQKDKKKKKKREKKQKQKDKKKEEDENNRENAKEEGRRKKKKRSQILLGGHSTSKEQLPDTSSTSSNYSSACSCSCSSCSLNDSIETLMMKPLGVWNSTEVQKWVEISPLLKDLEEVKNAFSRTPMHGKGLLQLELTHEALEKNLGLTNFRERKKMKQAVTELRKRYRTPPGSDSPGSSLGSPGNASTSSVSPPGSSSGSPSIYSQLQNGGEEEGEGVDNLKVKSKKQQKAQRK